MREIKFRGLTEGGTWVYGDLINYENGRKAIIGRQLSAPGYLSVEGARISPVRAETIGQLTGLTDKNGVGIYEGDRLFFDVRKDDRFIDSQAFSNERGVADLSPTGTYFGQWDSVYCTNITIVGNIHENHK